MPTKPIHLGLISALTQEQNELVKNIQNPIKINIGMREYTTGMLWDINCTCVVTRIGQVSVATTVTTLIERFNVTHLLFTGFASSADQDVLVGDIVVATELIQHANNTNSLFAQFEASQIGNLKFETDRYVSNLLIDASKYFIEHHFQTTISNENREEFGFSIPKIHSGLIASADECINDKLIELKNNLPDLLAIDMEGAAVAQICYEFNVPFSIIKIISDVPKNKSLKSITQFTNDISSEYIFHIIKKICSNN